MSEPYVPDQCDRPCPQCPWRIANQDKKHAHHFDTKANLTRLWNQIRKARSQGGGQGCHMTDPSHPDHVASGAPLNAKMKDGIERELCLDVRYPDDPRNEEDEPGDDLCDLCHTFGVNASRTTYCGKTIGVECGCDELFESGLCMNDNCDICIARSQQGDVFNDDQV